MGEYLLGLDAGNTVIKAVIFDLAGRETGGCRPQRATAACRARGMSSAISTNSGRNAPQVIRACIAKARHRRRTISPRSAAPAMATGSMRSIATARRCIGIQSLDTRAAGLVDEWREAGTSATGPIRIARQRPWPSQTPTLLAWLKRSPAGPVQPASVRCSSARISSSTA